MRTTREQIKEKKKRFVPFTNHENKRAFFGFSRLHLEYLLPCRYVFVVVVVVVVVDVVVV